MKKTNDFDSFLYILVFFLCKYDISDSVFPLIMSIKGPSTYDVRTGSGEAGPQPAADDAAPRTSGALAAQYELIPSRAFGLAAPAERMHVGQLGLRRAKRSETDEEIALACTLQLGQPICCTVELNGFVPLPVRSVGV